MLFTVADSVDAQIDEVERPNPLHSDIDGVVSLQHWPQAYGHQDGDREHAQGIAQNGRHGRCAPPGDSSGDGE